MADAFIEKTVNVMLSLDANEAKFLMGITQNYMGSDDSDESQEELKLRSAVFYSLKKALES